MDLIKQKEMAFVALATVIICNIWGKGMVKILPILIGVLVSYAVALVTGAVDFQTIGAAVQFLEYWNLVEQPMTFIESKTLWPLTLYLPEISIENAGQAFVASVISLMPTMLIFILTRNHLEKGIVASAVKE